MFILRKLTIFSLIFICSACTSIRHLTDAQVRNRIEAHKPLNGAVLPSDIKYRLGATHVDGKYYLTNEPFIIEGAEKLSELGYGILKLWFDRKGGIAKGYEYNSEWNIPPDISLKELAMHPYYKACFEMPFKTISLCVNELFPGNRTDDIHDTMEKVEHNIYELTKYLLDTYKEKDITFILQNWEGDWLLRGGTGLEAMWHINGPSADYEVRVKNMTDWLSARQRGVERARREVGEVKCKVLHAIEVNRVFDGINGIPSVATHILPYLKTDIVSWSAYDGIEQTGLKLYRGIDFLREQMKPTSYMKGQKCVMIGEIGYPENMQNRTRKQVSGMWDTFMGVFLAQNIPYVFIWELYCNELKNNEFDRNQIPVRNSNELRGFWLIRPDGSKSWGQQYMDLLLQNSVKTINK